MVRRRKGGDAGDEEVYAMDLLKEQSTSRPRHRRVTSSSHK